MSQREELLDEALDFVDRVRHEDRFDCVTVDELEQVFKAIITDLKVQAALLE